MDLEQFPQILGDIIADMSERLQPLIATINVLPQVKEVTTLKRRLTRSVRSLRDAVDIIPDAIESVHLHILEEGSVPNNVRESVREQIGLQQGFQRERAAAAALEAELRSRGNILLPMPRSRGGRRKRGRQVTKRRR